MERGAQDLSATAAASVLQWWSDAGVDVLVDEAPRDWLKPRPAPDTVARDPASAPGDALPDRLDLFQAYLADSQTLPFASPSGRRIGPSGDAASGLMMLVDMPSADDAETGTLLSGEAGRLFGRMLAAIGRDRTSIYLASLACFRSPTGRFTADTAKQCALLARHQVGLVSPKALLLFGDACSNILLGGGVAQMRGRSHEISTPAGPVRTFVTWSPDYLLKRPPAKAQAWADLQKLVEVLKA